jgi:hypothetical protein
MGRPDDDEGVTHPQVHGAERKPFGLLAECVDDQGAVFRLWQSAD